MTRKYILANTLTRHFIDFAKIMGFFSKIARSYKTMCDMEYDFFFEEGNKYYFKMSYYEYINNCLDYYGKTFLTDNFVKKTYFFGRYGYMGFDPIEVDYLTELFFSYLKEKNIIRYVRIDRS